MYRQSTAAVSGGGEEYLSRLATASDDVQQTADSGPPPSAFRPTSDQQTATGFGTGAALTERQQATRRVNQNLNYQTQRRGPPPVSSIPAPRSEIQQNWPTANRADRDEVEQLRSLVNTVGVVLEVWGEDVGRLLTPESLEHPRMTVYFDTTTFINGVVASADARPLSDRLRKGHQVDCVVQMAGSEDEQSGEKFGLRHCTGIIFDEANTTQTTEDESDEEVMLLVSRGERAAKVTSVKQESAIVLPQSLDHSDFMFKLYGAFQNSVDKNDPIFIKPPTLRDKAFLERGRSVSVRTVRLPEFVLSALSDVDPNLNQCQRLAIAIRPFGDALQGSGRIVKIDADRNGGTLRPLEEDEGVGEVYFKFITAADQNKARRCWQPGTLVMFEACRELPGRQYNYRAFRLLDAGNEQSDGGVDVVVGSGGKSMGGGDGVQSPRKPTLPGGRRHPPEAATVLPSAASHQQTMTPAANAVAPSPVETPALPAVSSHVDLLQGLLFDSPSNSVDLLSMLDEAPSSQTVCSMPPPLVPTNVVVQTPPPLAERQLRTEENEEEEEVEQARSSVSADDAEGRQTTDEHVTDKRRMRVRTYSDDRLAISDQEETEEEEEMEDDRETQSEETPVKVVDTMTESVLVEASPKAQSKDDIDGGDLSSAMRRLEQPMTVGVGTDLSAMLRLAAQQHQDVVTAEQRLDTASLPAPSQQQQQPPVSNSKGGEVIKQKDDKPVTVSNDNPGLPASSDLPKAEVAKVSRKSLSDLLGPFGGTFFGSLPGANDGQEATSTMTERQEPTENQAVAGSSLHNHVSQQPISANSKMREKETKVKSDSAASAAVKSSMEMPVCTPDGRLVIVNKSDTKKTDASARQTQNTNIASSPTSCSNAASAQSKTATADSLLMPDEFKFLYE